MVADLTPDRGRLIVATPDLEDPNFDGTVVLLLEHDPDGTVGVVLNRPSDLSVDEAMAGPPADDVDRWDDLVAPPSTVFVGGPVRPNAVVALALVTEVRDTELWEPIAGDLGVVRLGGGPVPEVGEIDALRVFAGYAGWGAGQLEGEIEAGAWFVVEGDPEDCFTPEPDQLWWQVLRRQGGMFTTVTDNPVLN